MTERLRVVVLRDGDLFIAQCLEIDIAAQGASEQQALQRLTAVLRAESSAAAEEGRDLRDIGPAPAAFHAIYGSNVVNRRELSMVA